VVIVICPSLEEVVRDIDPGAKVVLIENAPGSTDESVSVDQASAVRAGVGVARSVPLVLYTGTFEAYQGLDLLFAAMAVVRRRRPDVRLLLAGGRPDQVQRAQEQARALGVAEMLIFAGERPAPEIPAFLQAADVLVSPRSRGTNTPLKIYQYLRSGKPIVATRLLTHTQVLNDQTAILTGDTPEAFADGILAAIEDPGRAAACGHEARQLADTKYSYEAYLDRTRRVCALLAATSGPVGWARRVEENKGAKDVM
jgi:glycosyltransferase involved in cell wall biosynthesis